MVDFPQPDAPTIKPMCQQRSSSGKETCHDISDFCAGGKSKRPST
jgi:hypothetical protein